MTQVGTALPGSPEAFAALFSQSSSRLYRTALGILGNPHDAADALQDAGLKAFRYYHTLLHPDAAGAWLTRILVGVCYDIARRRARTVPSAAVEQAGISPPPDGDWELADTLQSLPEEQRVTVVLRFYQDLSIPQIAAVMQVPEGTVKSRLHTALKRLRSVLTAAGREEVR